MLYTPSRFLLLPFISIIFFFISSEFSLYAETSVRFTDNFSGINKSSQIQAYQFGDFTYVDAGEFASSLNLNTYEDNEKKKLVIYFQQTQFKLTSDNYFVTLNGSVIQLPAPVKTIDGDFFFPLQPIIRYTDGLLPGMLVFTGDILLYTEGDYSLTGIASTYNQNKFILDILTSKRVDFKVSQPGQNQININIPSGKINRRNFIPRTLPHGIDSIDCSNYNGGCEITFSLSAGTILDTIYFHESPKSIRIFFSGVTGNNNINDALKTFREGLKFNTIVIDPGHGGKDPGAVGGSGLKEKDVVLDIALRLEKLLQKEMNVNTILTRRNDEFIPLRKRGQIANESGGKLFISIHVNANRNRSAHGVETYFLSPARTEKALEVAELENASIQYETDKSYYQNLEDEDFILLAMSKSNDLKESEMLAGQVQDEFARKSGQRDRGVDQAGFYVLYGANMPAILFEAGFITNRREEKLMKTRQYRQQTAEILAESIINFCREKEKEK